MGGTWSVFRYSDAKSGGIVWNMYSNTVRYFTSGTYGATKGMNIEHSVPKSWWGDAADYNGTTPLTRFKYEASYDLHHLTPADADANEEKSNYPLGVVSTQSWTNGVTKVGTGYIIGMPSNCPNVFLFCNLLSRLYMGESRNKNVPEKRLSYINRLCPELVAGVEPSRSCQPERDRSE